MITSGKSDERQINSNKIKNIYVFKNKFSLCCSFGMFVAKFLCIFDTLFFFKYINNLFVWINFSVLSTVITSLVLSFQEAKAKPTASGCKAVGRFFVCFF